MFPGNPALSTTAFLRIAVKDIDDNCPVFSAKEYNVTVQENMPLNETIVTVHAKDVDTVGQVDLDYGIVRGNLGTTFKILRFAGKLEC